MKKAVIFLGIAFCTSVFGSVIVQTTGTAGGQPADAQATLTFGNGTLTVTLQNLETNPTADAQSLNGIDITIQGFTFSTVTDSSFSGTDISNMTDNTPNGWTTASDATNHWNFSDPTSDSFLMTAIGNPMAKYTLIGGPNSSNEYTNANSSITNGTHEPFLWESATWVLNVPGLTVADESDLSSVMFKFGTSSSSALPGTMTTLTPEPDSLTLAVCGLALIGLAVFTRRSRSSRS